jgi:hypothetical protein
MDESSALSWLNHKSNNSLFAAKGMKWISSGGGRDGRPGD